MNVGNSGQQNTTLRDDSGGLAHVGTIYLVWGAISATASLALIISFVLVKALRKKSMYKVV
jgi:hypothetical protein